ncbi:MAG TPA: Gfo/Idh/MocA family oxidoreductase [Candidatus Paceibacterota bacterium]|nr:Gfo/Idh/MocA family oxidoreductase [Verrucomicrobiota bacterium]HOX03614.1 Gfo/Idh/MocA family oxidoreductase [Verrucomicrobiota bacterium]HRZ46661.1 Gfo/Idh/MocA family oxidoreductase [Candidatus Paceibacterota bacterium]HRZ94786.1 Gfo/Idh/MocA family oxidoreductase [Candidatus Paceibacterota bacterium]
MTHHRISRRSFVKRGAILAAASGLPAWFIERELALAGEPARRPGPNDRPGIALIGCGGMGRGDANNALRFGDLMAVCDVDEGHAEAAAKQFTRDGKAPARYNDFRKVLEREDIQVIIQATPDHWHTLVNMAAVRAKKDVYGEKPLTLTIDEGRRLARAVRENRAVLQTGSQQRSDRRFRLVTELVRNGRLGKLRQVTVYLPAGLRGGPFAPSPVPAGLNWDYWLGQAPRVDYVKERCHTTFRYWLDYSGGTMTDWGAHHNDIARWAIGLEGPVSIEAQVRAEPVPGGYTAISEYEVVFTYANGVRQIVKTTPDDNIFGGVVKRDGQRNGLRFEGSEGWIWVNRGDLEASDEALLSTPLPESAARLEVSNDHMGNFFECVRTRRDPICHVEVGHRSASMCHLAAIALALRRKLEWDPAREQFVGDGSAQANARIAREQRRPYDYSFVG